MIETHILADLLAVSSVEVLLRCKNHFLKAVPVSSESFELGEQTVQLWIETSEIFLCEYPHPLEFHCKQETTQVTFQARVEALSQEGNRLVLHWHYDEIPFCISILAECQNINTGDFVTGEGQLRVKIATV